MSEERTFSQEELNSIVSERLNKEQDKFNKQIAELNSKAAENETKLTELNGQLETLKEQQKAHAQELAERDAKIKAYENEKIRMRVAQEFNIPLELANRLNGETEDDIKKDAESIKGLLEKQYKSAPPLKSTEERKGDELSNAMREIASFYERR